LKQKRSEKALRFVKEKKNALIAAVAVAGVVVMALLSFNYLREQEEFEAQRAFGQALLAADGRGTSMERLREVSRNHKGSVYSTYALMLLGQDFLNNGEYEEAIFVFDEALKSKQPAAFLTVQILESKASALEFDGSLDEALSTYKRALSVPNSVYRRNDILLKSALLNTRMGQYDLAKEQFEEIVASGEASDRVLRIARNKLSALGI
jgi:hypothetical protein